MVGNTGTSGSYPAGNRGINNVSNRHSKRSSYCIYTNTGTGWYIG